MSEQQNISEIIVQTRTLLREKLGVRAKDLTRAVAKAKHRLPRRVYQQASELARVETMAAHPKLCLMLDRPGLGAAADEVAVYLNSIDLADRRKGWILGMLGALVFNLLLFGAVLMAVLAWRGYL